MGHSCVSLEVNGAERNTDSEGPAHGVSEKANIGTWRLAISVTLWLKIWEHSAHFPRLSKQCNTESVASSFLKEVYSEKGSRWMRKERSVKCKVGSGGKQRKFKVAIISKRLELPWRSVFLKRSLLLSPGTMEKFPQGKATLMKGERPRDFPQKVNIQGSVSSASV